MSFGLIEHFVSGKSSLNEQSEDILFFNDNFFAVFDGATSKHPATNDITPGRKIVEIAAHTLSKLPYDIDFPAVIKAMNHDIRLAFADQTQSKADTKVETPSASLALISSMRKELWVLGDCQALIDGVNYQWPKLIDTTHAMYRAAVNQLALKEGISVESLQENDRGRDAILETLKKQGAFRNNVPASKFSYGALDGSDDALSYLKIIDISHAQDIVIGTDGYTKLFPSLDATEDHLQSVLARDPLMIFENIQTKGMTKGMTKGNASFDDRAYLKVKRQNSAENA